MMKFLFLANTGITFALQKCNFKAQYVVSYFKEKSATAVFGLIILSLLVRIFFWAHPPIMDFNRGDGLLFYVFRNIQFPAVVTALIYQAIVIIQALRLNYTLNDLRMLPKQGYTTAVAYVLLTAVIPSWNNINAALLANGLFIWLLFRFWKVYNSQNPKTILFNLGMIVSATILLYYPALPFILIAFFVLGSYRAFRANEWFTLILGLLTPAYFLGSWLFLTGRISLVDTEVASVKPHIIESPKMIYYLISFIVPLLIILNGIVVWQANSNRMVIQVRKNWSVLFWSFLCTLPAAWLFINAWPKSILLCTIPAASFISCGWAFSNNRWINAIGFWLLVALIVYNNWFVGNF